MLGAEEAIASLNQCEALDPDKNCCRNQFIWVHQHLEVPGELFTDNLPLTFCVVNYLADWKSCKRVKNRSKWNNAIQQSINHVISQKFYFCYSFQVIKQHLVRKANAVW